MLRPRAPWIPLVAVAIACAAPEPDPILPPVDTAPELPGNTECLPPGEAMSDAVCDAVVANDPRQPNVAYDHSNAPPPVPDWRADDPDFLWLTAEMERCACVCCHRARYDGPGVHRYDLDFGPVWIDSASDWSLRVLAGWEDVDAQRMLPTDDPERLYRIIQAELDRRAAAR